MKRVLTPLFWILILTRDEKGPDPFILTGPLSPGVFASRIPVRIRRGPVARELAANPARCTGTRWKSGAGVLL
jgi:hypothetical protein